MPANFIFLPLFCNENVMRSFRNEMGLYVLNQETSLSCNANHFNNNDYERRGGLTGCAPWKIVRVCLLSRAI